VANLYGVANPLMTCVGGSTIGLVDIVCNPGVETNVIDSGPLSSPSGGFFYPVVFFQAAMSNGATAPTGMTLGVRIGAGADFANIALAGLLNVANYNWFFSGMVAGPISQSVWTPPGSHMFVSCSPQGTGVTWRSNGSYAQFFLFRAADQ
jgi:hypothetical protein